MSFADEVRNNYTEKREKPILKNNYWKECHEIAHNVMCDVRTKLMECAKNGAVEYIPDKFTGFFKRRAITVIVKYSYGEHYEFAPDPDCPRYKNFEYSIYSNHQKAIIGEELKRLCAMDNIEVIFRDYGYSKYVSGVMSGEAKFIVYL